MAVNTNFQIPFLPQTGITEQILTAITAANEQHLQNQRLQLAQQAQQSTGQLQQAQAGETQARQRNLEAQTGGLAAFQQAQTEHLQAQTNLSNIQAKMATEKDPLQLALQQQQLDKGNVDLQMAKTKLALISGATHPLDPQVDRAIDPKTYPDLNTRTKATVDAFLQVGDLDGATKAIEHGSNTISEMDKTKYVQNREDVRASLGRAQSHANQIQAHGLDQIDKIWNDPQHGYGQFVAQANATKGAIEQSKNGSELASNLAPLMVVLGVNSFAGVHRINPIEYENAGPGLGSIYRRINAALDKAGSGSIPSDTIKEMNNLVDELIKVKHSATVGATQMLKNNTGITDDLTLLDRNGQPAPMSKVVQQSAPTAPKSQQDPLGIR